ncbi:MAG: peptidylprolyl isomerase, partial [Deltaproteobacteria bacterium]|nr:peptidylprolyl isomerase [Deltaproteobacteria bacterium]
GGELGVVEPTTLHPQVARAIARMQVGEVSDPIPSQTGYHILKLLDRGATSGADYQRLKEQIQQVIYQQKMAGAIEQYVRQLRQKSYVEIKG